MSIKKVVFTLTFLFILSSCVYTSEKSRPFEISINMPSIESSAIEINLWRGIVINKGSYYDLSFEGIQYGEKYFLGIKKMRSTSPDESPRLELVKDGEVIAKYSINELQKMNHRMIDDSIKVYLIPELL